jgi:hypothetical protein
MPIPTHNLTRTHTPSRIRRLAGTARKCARATYASPLGWLRSSARWPMTRRGPKGGSCTRWRFGSASGIGSAGAPRTCSPPTAGPGRTTPVSHAPPCATVYHRVPPCATVYHHVPSALPRPFPWIVSSFDRFSVTSSHRYISIYRHNNG